MNKRVSIMAQLDQSALRAHLLNASLTLEGLRDERDEHTIEYREGLHRVASMWSLLRMTRRREEFLPEVC